MQTAAGRAQSAVGMEEAEEALPSSAQHRWEESTRLGSVAGLRHAQSFHPRLVTLSEGFPSVAGRKAGSCGFPVLLPRSFPEATCSFCSRQE